jgi:hypothetical protein
VFVPGKSPVKVQPEILVIFYLELHVVYMDWWACFCISLHGEYDMDRLNPLAFILHFLNKYWISAGLTYSFCETMTGSLSLVKLNSARLYLDAPLLGAPIIIVLAAQLTLYASILCQIITVLSLVNVLTSLWVLIVTDLSLY